ENACDSDAFCVRSHVSRECGRAGLLRIAGQHWCQLHEPLARVDHDLARAQRLAGDVGGACRGAASTLGARVAVEQVLPGEVGDVCSTELFRVLGLEVHGAHDTNLPGPIGVGEVYVGQRDDDVQVLGVRQVVQEVQDEQ